MFYTYSFVSVELEKTVSNEQMNCELKRISTAGPVRKVKACSIHHGPLSPYRVMTVLV